MDAECKKCECSYTVRDGCEPTPFCDSCAHEEVERLNTLVDSLGVALRYQNERWGLYGDTSQKALKDFEQHEKEQAMSQGN